MDRAYEGNGTRQPAPELGFGRWFIRPGSGFTLGYATGKCERRNEAERMFRRLKGFHRILPRFEELDATSLGLVVFVPVFDGPTSVNTH